MRTPDKTQSSLLSTLKKTTRNINDCQFSVRSHSYTFYLLEHTRTWTGTSTHTLHTPTITPRFVSHQLLLSLRQRRFNRKECFKSLWWQNEKGPVSETSLESFGSCLLMPGCPVRNLCGKLEQVRTAAHRRMGIWFRKLKEEPSSGVMTREASRPYDMQWMDV